MRKTTILSLVTVVLLVGMAVWSFSFAREAPGKEKDNNVSMLRKPTGEPLFQILNINNLWWWVKFNGESAHSPSDDSGIYYPRDMVWCIYKDGIKWSGRAYLDAEYTQPDYRQKVRIGGNDYGVGSTHGGWIEGFGATAERISTDDERVRSWRIRRDYYVMAKDADGEWTDEITKDAYEYNEMSAGEAPSEEDLQEIYDWYDYDWKNWPVDLGAPYIDRNGNGQYDPPPEFSANFTHEDLIPGGYDEPGVAGADPDSPADQVIWDVFNDLDETLTLEKEGSYPMGWEMQRTVWGYKRTDALGNIAFSQTLIINKGGVQIDAAGNTGVFHFDSCWVWQWSDPDLGSAFDDLLGCDTTLNLGYVYNGNPIDREYARYSQVVPCAGYDFLAGPIVDSLGATAVFNLKYRQDVVNLGMTAFFWFSAGSAISDPGSDYEGGLEWDAMARGFQPHADRDEPYPFPPGVRPTKFPLAGDPVMGTGLVDGQGELYSFAPGDRRLGCSSGPFQIGPGDTQQVVMGFVVGQGADRLSSISVMKFNDRLAQLTYDNLFAVPSAPLTPDVTVTEIDEKVLLEWGSNLVQTEKIETTVAQPGEYHFEGYNVYQFPKAQSTLLEARRIATYDLDTPPLVVFDDQPDPNTGQILFMPVQFGQNSGVQRYYEFERDYYRDIDKIYNGTEYYLAVTAYSVAVDEEAIPRTLESPPQVMTVIPHRDELGYRYGADAYEVLTDITHTSGAGDAGIYPTVVDPEAVIDATYTFEWNTDTIWYIELGEQYFMFSYDLLRNGTALETGLTNYSGDENYDIYDGILFKVTDLTFAAPVDFTSITDVGDGSYDWDSYYVSGWANTALATDTWGAGTDDILLLQSDVEFRFTGEYVDPSAALVEVAEGTGSIATMVGARGYDLADHPMNPAPGTDERFTVRVPFEVWDIERDMQISCIIYDRIQGASDVPFYAFNPYNRMYVHLWSGAYTEDLITEAMEDQLTWNLVMWETDWEQGDVVTVQYANKIQPGEIYTLDTGDYVETMNAATAEADVERIQVYPNPYYAFNPAELSRLSRFVTFNNLPSGVGNATIRIFNLAGHLVRTIEKETANTFQRWDLQNNDGLPVATGMYIAHITVKLPSGGESTKVLKLAIIQEQEVLDVY